MDPFTGGLGSPGARKPMRSLQPRAAAALDFNDDSDDDDGGLLSADYKAQRRTTQDLVDFFKNAPPPPPTLPPIVEEEKKKRTLLQRLRSKKSNSSINGSTGNGTIPNRSSVLVSGNGSNISTSTALTSKNKGRDEPTMGTLPNGKKYIMIAVDYKDKDGAGGGSTESGSALASGASSLNNASRRGTSSIATGSSSRRQSRALDDDAVAKRMSTLSNHITTTTTVYDGSNANGSEKRRSILLQPTVPSTEGSMFGLDSMLGNFAIDTDFMSASSKPVGAGSADGTNGTSTARPNSKSSGSGPNSAGSNGPGGEDMSRNGSKRGNKVTFNITPGQAVPLDEAAVDEALSQRLAAHKAQQQANGIISKSTSPNGANPGPRTLEDFPEITLPKPVSRKKVRHVQIQTQHCIMRPMYTQTEPMDVVHDLEVKEWGTQTSDSASEAGTSTTGTVVAETTSTSVGTTNGTKGTMTTARPNSKVASLVASLSQPTAATTTTQAPAMNSRGQSTGSTQTTTTTSAAQTTDKETDFSNATPAELQQALLQMRQQNTQLQSRVTTLERDLASEMRARTRTAVAMQDTRDKFEMLSAMAYKKLKEMIFQRHVLEMEIRELRAQVDLQGEDVYLHQRNAVAVGQN
ncbi:hypothetical protein BGZ81_000329 [Podila clonocystis]|nr:hypothetical protein BGZ81_000329 [Podila clonocystis]